MEMLPPVGWADVATKRDLDALSHRIDGRFELLELRLASLDDRTSARFTAVDHQIRGLRHELVGEMHAMQPRLLMWLLPTVLAGVGASAAVARLV